MKSVLPSSPHTSTYTHSSNPSTKRREGEEKRVISKSLIYYMYIYNRLRGRPGGEEERGELPFLYLKKYKKGREGVCFQHIY